MSLTLNKEYRFINKEYDEMALNVYGTSSVANGRNVCLYDKDEDLDDEMQRWKYQYDSGYGNRLHCVKNTDYVLDRSSGMTNSCANNAHTYKGTSTTAAESAITFVAVSGETDVYKIRLTNRVNNEFLFLTAANNNGTLPASAVTSSTLTTANKNVYWATEATSGAAHRKQCWQAVEYTSGGSSGGNTGGDSGGDENTYVINGVILPLSDCPLESYWTTDGLPSDKEGTTSKSYNGIQCAGFARYVYAQIWGSDTNGAQLDSDKGELHTVSGNYSDFSSLPIGTRLICTVRQSFDSTNSNFDKTRTNSHQMIILKKTNSEITVYHANWDEHCKIQKDEWSYTEFYNRFKEIKGASYIPPFSN